MPSKREVVGPYPNTHTWTFQMGVRIFTTNTAVSGKLTRFGNSERIMTTPDDLVSLCKGYEDR